MSDAPTTEDFDVTDWLKDAINAESSITVYRDGTTLLELSTLAALAKEAKENAENSARGQLSIADEYAEVAEDAVKSAEEARAKLEKSGITFDLRSIGTESRDVLLKQLERDPRFKGSEKTSTTDAVPSGQGHPDYFEAYQHELMAKVIVKVTTADGKVDTRPWTPERVAALRALPMFEFNRLWNKVHELHYKQYDIEQMIDLDFSSRF